VEKDPHRFQKFLEAMVPKTATIIDMVRKQMKHRLSMKAVVDIMEPFKVYTSDINYAQYNQIRFFIKEQIKEFKTAYLKRGDEFSKMRSVKYAIAEMENRLERMFFEKQEIAEMFFDSYNFAKPDKMKYSESEFAAKIIKVDQGTLFYSLLQFMMISLITPENLLESMEETDDMSSQEKIKAKDCVTRVITKKYDSLKNLQKDNGEQEIFTDKEFDDSPYELYKKYKDDSQKYLPEEFVEYVTENLIQKHDAPISMAAQLAQTIIAGKRKVQEGEYAILEIKPQLPAGSDESKLTEKE
jgi:hypothetical protein